MPADSIERISSSICAAMIELGALDLRSLFKLDEIVNLRSSLSRLPLIDNRTSSIEPVE